MFTTFAALPIGAAFDFMDPSPDTWGRSAAGCRKVARNAHVTEGAAERLPIAISCRVFNPAGA